jgi:hypothetical protein
MRRTLFIILCMIGGTQCASQISSSQTGIEQEAVEEQYISWTEYRGKYKDYTKSVEAMHLYHLVGIVNIEKFQKPTKENLHYWRLKKKNKGEIQT